MIAMEIRNVTETQKKEYPKMNQITEKKLRHTIPNKWLKVGLSSLMIAMLMKNNVLATSSVPDYTMELAGETQLIVDPPLLIVDSPLIVQICPAVQVVSFIVFIISSIAILKTKSKAKKQKESKKVKKWIKVIFIISILLFILSTSIRILYPLFEMV